MFRLFFAQSLIVLCFVYSATLLAQNLQLNGIALHEELGSEQFLAALYLPEPSGSAKDVVFNIPRQRLEIKILLDEMSPRRFRRMWIEGVAINAKTSELEAQANNLEQFSKMNDVRLNRGDLVRLEKTSNETSVFLNDTLLGSIADARFYGVLIRTLIGAVPLSSEIKQGLLASGKVDSTLASRFNSLNYSQSRQTEIASQVDAGDEQASASTAESEPPKDSASIPSAPAVPIAAAPKVASPAAKQKPKVAEKKKAVKKKKVAKKKQVEKKVVKREILKPINKSDDATDTDEDEFSARSILAKQLYMAELRKWTQKNVRYPNRAAKRKQEGSVRIEVTINRTGEVVETLFLAESEHAALNEAALKAVNKSAPYPLVPAAVKGKTFSFTAPFSFKLQ